MIVERQPNARRERKLFQKSEILTLLLIACACFVGMTYYALFPSEVGNGLYAIIGAFLGAFGAALGLALYRIRAGR